MGLHRKLKVGVLTSSRADWGYYLPVVKELKASPDDFSLEIIAFGTHLSTFHGHSIDKIIEDGFKVKYRISSMLLTDDEESVSTSYALTALKFASFWSGHKNEFDVVFCLGDRFEMAAAVQAGIPFGIRFAHIGGGDTTLGAIDNIYRHTITLASSVHFVTTEMCARRVKELAGKQAHCIVTGAPSLDNLVGMSLFSKPELYAKWGIDLAIPTILITVHPETVHPEKNKKFSEEVIKALEILTHKYQLVITMPNTDTEGCIFRTAFQTIQKEIPDKVKLIENFGPQSYFSFMSHSELVLGNSSSGIIEAASLGKFVINIGDRQNGRHTSKNIRHVSFNADEIIEGVNSVKSRKYKGSNVYYKGNAAQAIIQTLKTI